MCLRQISSSNNSLWRFCSSAQNLRVDNDDNFKSLNSRLRLKLIFCCALYPKTKSRMKDDTSLIWLNFKSVSYTQKENDNFLASEKKLGLNWWKNFQENCGQRYVNNFPMLRDFTPYATKRKRFSTLLQIPMIMDKPLNF